MNRRKMLGLFGGAMVAGFGASMLPLSEQQAEAAMPVEQKPFSWTPRIIDAVEVERQAHESFYTNGYGCGYGVFYSIIGTMGAKWGAPYNSFPFSMLEMGKGGVSDWGTLCGALLGAVSSMALFWGRAERDPMVDELFRWYETTMFPVYKPIKSIKPGMEKDLPKSVSGSVLCHISVSKWSYSSGFAAKSPERSERCARITADVAKKTVEIMTAKINGSFKPVLAESDLKKGCTASDCHGSDPEKFQSPILKGKMDCTPCHTGSEHVQNKTVNHP